MTPPVSPTPEAFLEQATIGNVIPVFTELAADFETPLSIFYKIREERYSFLFESAESSAASGRYSILGCGQRLVLQASGKEIYLNHPKSGKKESFNSDQDVLAEMQKIMQRYDPVVSHDLPKIFNGGWVGYLAYEAVCQFESTVPVNPNDDLGLPDAVFMMAEGVIIFDHHLRKIFIVANAFVDDFDSPDEAYAGAVGQIKATLFKLDKPLKFSPFNGLAQCDLPPFRSNTTKQEYMSMVERGKELIAAGDIFQFVPSQRFESPFTGSPIELYRSLRHVNPSPYMFILELDGFALVGSSPEVHVRSIEGRIDIRPIAGTRWRGASEEEDEALAQDLLNDKKECAEHLMLVDLARNDVGRIAAPGSVLVDDFMIVERYSHVMHIVSNVHGQLAPQFTAYDALRATFPAGTVSGAPKIRAMQIIAEFEKAKRCAYAGAVGYFGFDGSFDSCIALRTCLLKDGKAYVQAGAGVVADSQPEYEYLETCNKARGMLKAIALANHHQSTPENAGIF